MSNFLSILLSCFCILLMGRAHAATTVQMLQAQLSSKVAEIHHLHTGLRSGQVLKRLTDQFQLILDEKVIRTEETSSTRTSQSSYDIVSRNRTRAQVYMSSNWLLGAIEVRNFSISLPVTSRTDSYSRRDITAFIPRNEEALKQFNMRTQKQIQDLQIFVDLYFQENLDRIIDLKLKGIEALRLITALYQLEVPVEADLLAFVIDSVQQIHFLADQEVTLCKKINYSNKENIQKGESTTSWLFGSEKTGSYLKQEKQLAYSIENCANPATAQVQAHERDRPFAIQLKKLESSLQAWVRAAETGARFYFPTKDTQLGIGLVHF